MWRLDWSQPRSFQWRKQKSRTIYCTSTNKLRVLSECFPTIRFIDYRERGGMNIIHQPSSQIICWCTSPLSLEVAQNLFRGVWQQWKSICYWDEEVRGSQLLPRPYSGYEMSFKSNLSIESWWCRSIHVHRGDYGWTIVLQVCVFYVKPNSLCWSDDITADGAVAYFATVVAVIGWRYLKKWWSPQDPCLLIT